MCRRRRRCCDLAHTPVDHFGASPHEFSPARPARRPYIRCVSTSVARLPAADRPRERRWSLGPAALTSAELLGAGGVGPTKAARLLAAFELGARTAREERPALPRIREPEDVVRLFAGRLRDLQVEEFHLLALDSQSQVLREVLVTRGLLNSSLVHPREVFRAAIVEAAAGIIVVHNHPSGDPTPSAEDRTVTQQLAAAGRLLDLPLYDHVIIAGDRFTSFAAQGLL